MSQVDVVIQEKIQPKKVDLAIVAASKPDGVSVGQNTEPIQETQWLSLMTEIDKAESKDQLKKLWNDNKGALDTPIPKPLLQQTRWAGAKEVLLKEYLLVHIQEIVEG